MANVETWKTAYSDREGKTAGTYADHSRANHFWDKHVLADTLKNGQLEVYYQPKHNVATGELIGAEALVRWKHPSLGVLQPQLFLKWFEKNGLITQLDNYVWECVCKDLSTWMESGIPVVSISVNTTHQDYLSGKLWETWNGRMVEYSIPPELLHVEVAETVIPNAEDEMMEQLSRFRTSGIQVEIDDFGIGYSSLSRLSRYPFDVIKLDKQFLDNLSTKKGACIVSSCISMAKELNIKIVAEGVETSAQMDQLRAMNCDIVQGYFYSQAMPNYEFRNYLEKSFSKAN